MREQKNEHLSDARRKRNTPDHLQGMHLQGDLQAKTDVAPQIEPNIEPDPTISGCWYFDTYKRLRFLPRIRSKAQFIALKVRGEYVGTSVDIKNEKGEQKGAFDEKGGHTGADMYDTSSTFKTYYDAPPVVGSGMPLPDIIRRDGQTYHCQFESGYHRGTKQNMAFPFEHWHFGLDLHFGKNAHMGANFGLVPVYSTVSGRVSALNKYGGNGGWIGIEDKAGKVMAFYEHLNDIVVDKDAEIMEGQTIGYVGSTGTDNPHLHYGILTKSKDGTEDSYLSKGFYHNHKDLQGWREINPMDNVLVAKNNPNENMAKLIGDLKRPSEPGLLTMNQERRVSTQNLIFEIKIMNRISFYENQKKRELDLLVNDLEKSKKDLEKMRKEGVSYYAQQGEYLLVEKIRKTQEIIEKIKKEIKENSNKEMVKLNAESKKNRELEIEKIGAENIVDEYKEITEKILKDKNEIEKELFNINVGHRVITPKEIRAQLHRSKEDASNSSPNIPKKPKNK